MPLEAQNFKQISERRQAKWKNRSELMTSIKSWKTTSNMSWQQFEQLLTIYLHNIIEFTRPTSD